MNKWDIAMEKLYIENQLRQNKFFFFKLPTDSWIEPRT